MTDTQLLDTLTKNLEVCIKEREEKMAHVTDTGTMWTRNAFFEVLKFIRDNRGKAALTENGAKDE